MSADRELLELAAKAVGMLVLLDGAEWPKEKVGWFFNQVGSNPPALYDRASPVLTMWAPLTDDGDALRLAVKLRLSVDVFRKHTSVTVDFLSGEHEVCREKHAGDASAATRRAIVRAAAEIGKGMK